MKIHNSLILNNYSGFAVYLPSEDQKILTKFDFYKNEYERYINGIIGGVWGNVKLKRNGACAECPKLFKKSTHDHSRNGKNLQTGGSMKSGQTKKCSFI